LERVPMEQPNVDQPPKLQPRGSNVADREVDGSLSRAPSAGGLPSPTIRSTPTRSSTREYSMSSTPTRSNTREYSMITSAGHCTMHPIPGSGGGNLDPPRPAKEGYEWVWFPEGYWAEREFRPIETANQGAGAPKSQSPEVKVWKWRRKSGRSRSSSHEQEPPTISPRSAGPFVLPLPTTPQTPYLSEQAHVHSLQHPDCPVTTGGGSPDADNEWLSPKRNISHNVLYTPLSNSRLPSLVPTEDTIKPKSVISGTRSRKSSKGRALSIAVQKPKDASKHPYQRALGAR